MQNLRPFYAKAFALALVMGSVQVMAQPADHSHAGEPIQRTNAMGELVDAGRLFLDDIFLNTEIANVTLRYAPDTTIHNSNGNLSTVERAMDLYYPDPSILMYKDGVEITKLPMIVFMHAGQGNRLTAKSNALELTRLGYITLVPSYRLDKVASAICKGVDKGLYMAVQDARAVIRKISKLHDVGLESSPEEILATYGEDILAETQSVLESRLDGHSIFFLGFSGGGLTISNIVLSPEQEHWPSYLIDTEPFIVTAEGQSFNLSQNGLLDAVGMPFTADYPFPQDRIRGGITRATVYQRLYERDFNTIQNKVPLCLFHNTCDRLVPWNFFRVDDDTEACIQGVTMPDGTVLGPDTVYGSFPIANYMAANNVYAELHTICGGGHNSNNCINDLLVANYHPFLHKILKNTPTENYLKEKVYRFHPDNYSNQCCSIGDYYQYIEQCSCNEDNGYEVFDIDYISEPSCLLSPECEIDDYCSLPNPLSVYDEENFKGSVRLLFDEKGLYIEAIASRAGEQEIRFVDVLGRILFSERVMLTQNEQRIYVPRSLPNDELIIGMVGDVGTVKFTLHGK